MARTAFSSEMELYCEEAQSEFITDWLVGLQMPLSQYSPPSKKPCMPVPGAGLVCVVLSQLVHLPLLVDWLAVTLMRGGSGCVPVQAPPYSSASWKKVCPPSCWAANAASTCAPDQIMGTPPEFHHWSSLRTTPFQSTMIFAGSRLLIALFTLVLLM